MLHSHLKPHLLGQTLELSGERLPRFFVKKSRYQQSSVIDVFSFV